MATPPHETPSTDFPEIAEVVFITRLLTHRYEGETDLEWRERTLKGFPKHLSWALCRPGDEHWSKRLIV